MDTQRFKLARSSTGRKFTIKLKRKFKSGLLKRKFGRLTYTIHTPDGTTLTASQKLF